MTSAGLVFIYLFIKYLYVCGLISLINNVHSFKGKRKFEDNLFEDDNNDGMNFHFIYDWLLKF